MATIRGRAEVSSYLSQLPHELAAKVLRGAGRAGGKILAAEAKQRSSSDDVAADIIVKTRNDQNQIVVTVTVKPGYNWFRALWLEYGTDPHFISVSDAQRGGQGIRRINQKVREAKGEGSLVIGGEFVGQTIWHPGARPYPFFRPAFDAKEGDALKEAQAYINARISRRGITATEEGDDA